MRGDRMDYEVYEPDLDDEFYDQLCEDAWATMFNDGFEYSEEGVCTQFSL
jgi:hypothetical protein